MSQIITISRKKQSEVIKLDDVMSNCELVGSISSRIKTDLRYKPSEVVQLPPLLTMWYHLEKYVERYGVDESNIERWPEIVLNETRQVFRICTIGCLGETFLDREI